MKRYVFASKYLTYLRVVMTMIGISKRLTAGCMVFFLMISMTVTGAESSWVTQALSDADSSLKMRFYRDQFDTTTSEKQDKHGNMLEARGKISGFVGDNGAFGVDAYIRHDQVNDDKILTGFDELWLQTLQGNLEVTMGYQIVDMGAMEHKPIVDVLNSRDFQYDWLRPAKIGSPLLSLKYLGDNNNLSMFYSPYFIPNRVPGEKSNLHFTSLNTDDSDVRQDQWTVRYSYLGNGFDLGLSYMKVSQKQLFSSPHEPLDRNRRLGLELTSIYKNILLRGEISYQKNAQGDAGSVGAVGWEYTSQSLWGKSDLTLVHEYLFNNSKGLDQTVLDENYLAFRWAANDNALTQIEAIVINQRCGCSADVYRLSLRRSLNAQSTLEVQWQNSSGYFSQGLSDEDGSGWLRIKLEYTF
jgi:hypothetical protein